ncbi:unnamed protein product [Polarella glacialis]|uniref:Uncharacterized protein n=2 Tax=Polarella glacialis TaxID=89957 RepID=A0A813I0W2_POLGL|nr:unnamed protein product [Polarella glacialis]
MTVSLSTTIDSYGWPFCPGRGTTLRSSVLTSATLVSDLCASVLTSKTRPLGVCPGLFLLTVETPDRRCSVCLVIFPNSNSMRSFIKNYNKGENILLDGRKMYINENKTLEERIKDKSVRKLCKVILDKDPLLKDSERLWRKYYQGVVGIDKLRVGEWQDGKFVINVAGINTKSLGFSGESIQEEWDKERK